MFVAFRLCTYISFCFTDVNSITDQLANLNIQIDNDLDEISIMKREIRVIRYGMLPKLRRQLHEYRRDDAPRHMISAVRQEIAVQGRNVSTLRRHTIKLRKDVAKMRQKVRKMLREIPKELEDYGDPVAIGTEVPRGEW